MKSLRKKLFLSILAVAFAVVSLATSTFAWFSMNTTVTATNMQVRAKAEQGILINEVATSDDTNWDNEATANQVASSAALLYPASTADGSTWYHAASKKSNDSASATSGTGSQNLVNDYETLSGLVAITTMSATGAAGTTATRSTMGKAADAPAGYYVQYKYYLKSSSTEITLAKTSGSQNLRIKSVTATPEGNNSTDLNKSLRVGIKLNSEFYIYAPITGFTASYYVNKAATATTAKAGNVATLTDLATLPASNADGVEVLVFIWYEGEDANCKTDNALAATLDNIKVDIEFDLFTVTA